MFGKQLFRISPLVNVTAPLGLLTVFYDLWTSKKMKILKISHYIDRMLNIQHNEFWLVFFSESIRIVKSD